MFTIDKVITLYRMYKAQTPRTQSIRYRLNIFVYNYTFAQKLVITPMTVNKSDLIIPVEYFIWFNSSFQGIVVLIKTRYVV